MRKQVNANHQDPCRYDEPGAEVLRDTSLEVEELEPVIAPLRASNHNETFLAVAELEAEELEPVIAPLIATNHNETFLS
jgi:hypothetical protein